MRSNTSSEERFWSHVQKTSDCWNWTASVCTSGYGQFTYKGRNRLAHRLAYELIRGDIPNGLTIDHLCRNRRCVNPSHLEAVPIGINVKRGTNFIAVNSRKTHCVNGHSFTKSNTYRYHYASGWRRSCRTCAIQQATLRQRLIKLNNPLCD
jgi:hypothetical protein